MPRLREEGRFCARVIGARVKEFESGAAAQSLQFEVYSQYRDGQWADHEPEHVWGDVWLVKKDGTAYPKAIENLVAVFGWDGDVESWFDEGGDIRADLPACQIVTRAKDEKYLEVAWVNPLSSDPEEHGSGTGASDDHSARIKAKYGAQIGAIARACAVKSGKTTDGGDIPF